MTPVRNGGRLRSVQTTDEDLRVTVYRALAGTGRVPAPDAIADTLGCSGDDVRAGLRRLHRARHLVLDPARAGTAGTGFDGGTAIVMAHPFATIPLGFTVMGSRTLWWGGCAWDSFALPHLLPDEPEVLVATRCPGCAGALSWVVGRTAPPSGEQVAHFLVPVARLWDDVVHACSNQRLFCGPDCVQAWLHATGHAPGSMLDLPTLWRLARNWYTGRLDHGYLRRDPASSAEYFRDVGLTGPFWGL
jgi:hypothetical protein